MNGIITDLHNTLWSWVTMARRILRGGAEAHTQLHGLYQNLVASLASQGVLIAIASKNDAALAGAALTRPDMLLKPDRVFPLEIQVSGIRLWEQNPRTRNVAADSVVLWTTARWNWPRCGPRIPEWNASASPVRRIRAGMTCCGGCGIERERIRLR
jgi:hypothetical protein